MEKTEIKKPIRTKQYWINYWDKMEEQLKDMDNPASYCIMCNKFIGMRGFCSTKCHDEYYSQYD